MSDNPVNEVERRTLWKIHEERLIDDTRRLDLRIAHVELPDGVHFKQYVLRMPKAAMAVPIDASGENVLMIWRHRFVVDRWTWELPGGYVDFDEDPAMCAAREVEEETGWHPSSVRPLGSFQPLTGTADFENLLFLAEGCERTAKMPDSNEAARVEWIPLRSVSDLIARGEIIGLRSTAQPLFSLTSQQHDLWNAGRGWHVNTVRGHLSGWSGRTATLAVRRSL